MKRIISMILAPIICLSLCACSGSGKGSEVQPAPTQAQVVSQETQVCEEVDHTEASLADFPYVGTWTTPEGLLYLRVQEDGIIVVDSVIVSTGTSTINGVTTNTSSKRIMPGTYTFTWAVSNDQFIFNGQKVYEPTVDNGEYWLISDGTKYRRVGELDYVISLDDNADNVDVDIRDIAEEYVLDTVILAKGIELVLTEAGISQDIRVTSKTSGIQITSGPSPEAGKKFIYAKGTLKYTGTSATRAVIGGTIFLDDYAFNLQVSTIGTDGTPSSTVDPFETVHLLLYAQVSDEIANMFTDGRIGFGFNDNFENVQVDQAKYLYWVAANK
ncbi:MAG: hypothetical protein J6V25_05950 [Oscillospiraceae bacterium]|nr:hypothetical protein [Oscillospiraceae bacterium]